jgi:hypothetical protein
MRDFLRPAALAALVTVAAACGGASSATVSPGSSGPPSGAPSPTPSPSSGDADHIDHATGSTDVLLRYDVGGGFVAAGFSASQTPLFTLYGDGRIVFRNQQAAPPDAVGGATPNAPLRTARLSEEQIQETLRLALGQGGLGTARLDYPNPLIADAPNTYFSIDAGGVKKTVTIVALGMDSPDVPDLPARAAFNVLAQRLGDFDRGGTIPTDEFAPDRYRGILLEGFPGGAPPKAWPWSDVKPTDFVSKGDPNAFQTPMRVLTSAQVASLGITPFNGGFQNLILAGTDKKLYALAVRPLLPEETE